MPHPEDSWPSASSLRVTRNRAGLDRFIEILGMDDQLVVAAWNSGRPAIEFNRGRQHEAVVIVRVLPNQVHAVNVRGRAKARLESVKNLEGRIQ